jgi:hypothetical protein
MGNTCYNCKPEIPYNILTVMLKETIETISQQ